MNVPIVNSKTTTTVRIAHRALLPILSETSRSKTLKDTNVSASATFTEYATLRHSTSPLSQHNMLVLAPPPRHCRLSLFSSSSDASPFIVCIAIFLVYYDLKSLDLLVHSTNCFFVCALLFCSSDYIRVPKSLTPLSLSLSLCQLPMKCAKKPNLN